MKILSLGVMLALSGCSTLPGVDLETADVGTRPNMEILAPLIRAEIQSHDILADRVVIVGPAKGFNREASPTLGWAVCAVSFYKEEFGELRRLKMFYLLYRGNKRTFTASRNEYDSGYQSTQLITWCQGVEAAMKAS